MSSTRPNTLISQELPLRAQQLRMQTSQAVQSFRSQSGRTKEIGIKATLMEQRPQQCLFQLLSEKTRTIYKPVQIPNTRMDSQDKKWPAFDRHKYQRSDMQVFNTFFFLSIVWLRCLYG